MQTTTIITSLIVVHLHPNFSFNYWFFDFVRRLWFHSICEAPFVAVKYSKWDFGLDFNALVNFSKIFASMKKKWVFPHKLLFMDLSFFALGLVFLIKVLWCWIELCVEICILVCHVVIWGLFKFGFMPFVLLRKKIYIVATATMVGQGVAWRHFARFASSTFSASFQGSYRNGN